MSGYTAQALPSMRTDDSIGFVMGEAEMTWISKSSRAQWTGLIIGRQQKSAVIYYLLLGPESYALENSKVVQSPNPITVRLLIYHMNSVNLFFCATNYRQHCPSGSSALFAPVLSSMFHPGQTQDHDGGMRAYVPGMDPHHLCPKLCHDPGRQSQLRGCIGCSHTRLLHLCS